MRREEERTNAGWPCEGGARTAGGDVARRVRRADLARAALLSRSSRSTGRAACGWWVWRSGTPAGEQPPGDATPVRRPGRPDAPRKAGLLVPHDHQVEEQ